MWTSRPARKTKRTEKSACPSWGKERGKEGKGKGRREEGKERSWRTR